MDTSPDDSEVGAWYLGLKLKTSKDQKGKEIESLQECNLLNSAIIARKKYDSFQTQFRPLDNVEKKDWFGFI